MNDTVELIYRSIKDIRLNIESDFFDPDDYLNLNICIRSALSSNPFLLSDENTIQIFGTTGNRIIGSITLFPMQIIADGEKYDVVTGSTLAVTKKFRNTELGLVLPNKLTDISNAKCAIVSGMSRLAIPVYLYSGYCVFTTKRLIFLNKSRSILEMKIQGKILRFISSVLDVFLFLYKEMLNIFVSISILSFKVEKLESVPRDVESIISFDSHRFRENHTQEWFEWHLNHSFSEDKRSNQSFYVVRKRSEIVGFFMTKTRYKEQASHRGFKNVLLGSVIEWGTKDNSIISDKSLCLLAVLSFGSKIDAVEICSEDENVIKHLKKCGLRHVGDSNFAVKVDNNSPIISHSGYDRQENWRIRPASGDNGLS